MPGNSRELTNQARSAPSEDDFHRSPTNNALHDAILEHDNVAALRLISFMSTTQINHKSLGNTPLMLALKIGNLEVAKAMLEMRARDIALFDGANRGNRLGVPDFPDNATDLRGVSPLHIACSLRANEIILLMLDIYKTRMRVYSPRSFQETDAERDAYYVSLLSEQPNAGGHTTLDDLGISVRLDPIMFPGASDVSSRHGLFSQTAIARAQQQIAGRAMCDIYAGEYDFEDINRYLCHRGYNQSIVDSADSFINKAPEITDMILFHMKSLCVNLRYLYPQQFESQQVRISDNRIFAHNLRVGLREFITQRNRVPLDPQIVAMLRRGAAPDLSVADGRRNRNGMNQ